MKKPLLITSTLVVLALSATSIYAQVVAGTSIVDKMKAAAHSFTLSSVLNPTDTGLQSSPIKGKKTGDILTAGEWNRVLELLGEGGSGGGAGWENVSLAGTENFDDSCMYRYQITYSAGGREPYVPKETYYYVNGVSSTQLVWWLENDSQMSTYHISASSKDKLRINGTPYTTWWVNVTKIEKLCGGGGASAGGTSNITWANFDGSGSVVMKWSNGITSIVRESAGNYRVTFSTPRPNTDYGIICTSGPSPSYLCFPNDKSTTSFLIKTSNPSNNVDAPFVSLIVTPFETGAGSLASSPAFYYCTNAQSADANNAPCYGAKQNQGSGNGRYRTLVAHLSVPSYSPSNLSMFPWHDGTKWKCAISGVGHFDCTDGSVLVADTQASGGGSSSSWVDVPLTDTADYDTSCEYRFQLNKALVDGNWSFGSPTPAGNHYYYATYVANNIITASGTYNVMHGIPKGTKNKLFLYWVTGTGVDYSPSIYTTKIQKRCN